MTWSYRGGEWFGVFGENAVVVLPPSEKSRVGAVWELVDDGAGFDETLDALISCGLRDLPGFVLVSRDGDETRVVLRGEAYAHFATADGVVHVDGDRATTWVERTLHGVTRIHLEVSGEHAPEDLALSRGLVRIASAEWGAEPAATGRDSSQDSGRDSGRDAGQDTGRHTGRDRDTDHDGHTRGGTPTPERALPGIPGQPPAPPVTARPVARLVLPDGETVDVDRVVLVGRAPETRAGVEGETRLVRVPSPHQEISATHLEVRPGSGADHGSAVVTDLGSTNGTLLVQPGLPPEDLKAGIGVQLLPGAVIDLGDGVSIQVVGP